jgi:hypothetical protein
MSVLLRRGGAVKYALLIYGSRSATDDRADEELRDISEGYAEIFKLAGVSSGTQLQPVETATSIRVDDGRTVLCDGPFVDGEEVLVGSFLFEGHDLDEAIEVAALIKPKQQTDSRLPITIENRLSLDSLHTETFAKGTEVPLTT